MGGDGSVAEEVRGDRGRQEGTVEDDVSGKVGGGATAAQEARGVAATKRARGDDDGERDDAQRTPPGTGTTTRTGRRWQLIDDKNKNKI